MLKIFKYLKPYTLALILLVALVYIQVWTSLQLPDYMAKIINQGIVGKDNNLIIQTGVTMLLISLLGAASMIVVGFLASRIATGFSMNIRNRVFSKVESFSLAEFNKFSTASLITRSTNDIQQIQMVLIIILRMVLMAPLMGIGAIIKAYDTAPSMSWIIVLAVVVMMGMIIVLFSVALPKFKLLQKLVDKLNLVTRQNLTGLRVIRAFNNENIEEGKFEKANVDLTDTNRFVNRLMVIMQPLMMLIFNFAALTIVWVGAHKIDTNTLQIGDMLAFMQYSMQVIMSFLLVSIVFIMVPRASVSASRVDEVLQTEPIIKDPEEPPLPKGEGEGGRQSVDIPSPAGQAVQGSEEPSSSRRGGRRPGEGVVEFKNVTFIYPTADTPAIENITFTANPGETTAIIGSTGSGKSTLINLIPRFYDVTEGQILVDGLNIKQMKLDNLYAKIGYVPQKAVLFSGTVESNIKYGAPDANEAEVISAARIAQATEFIDQLEDKYKNSIAQGGANVSGGQKQRLSIARAIARNPEIYLFDDSFSALDFKTDSNLRLALEKEIKNKTIIIVGQRISTIMNANNIIVLDEGKIVGQGTHTDLLQNCKVYKEIAYSQLSEEELQTHLSHIPDVKGDNPKVKHQLPKTPSKKRQTPNIVKAKD